MVQIILKTMKIVISYHIIILLAAAAVVAHGLLNNIETNLIVLLLEVLYGLNALKNLNIVLVIVKNKVNVVIMPYLIGAILKLGTMVKNQKNAKDLVYPVLMNYHLIVNKKSVTISVLKNVEL